jgi:hypothetical protein
MSVTVHSHWVFLTGLRDDLFAFCDTLIQALLDQERCLTGFSDSAVSADAARGLIEIEANATGDDLSHAMALVQSAVRSALHALGAGTPYWPTHDEALSMVLKELHTEQIQPA